MQENLLEKDSISNPNHESIPPDFLLKESDSHRRKKSIARQSASEKERKILFGSGYIRNSSSFYAQVAIEIALLKSKVSNPYIA